MNGATAAQHRRSLRWAAFWTALIVPAACCAYLLVEGVARGESLADPDLYRLFAAVFLIGFPVSLLAIIALGFPLVLWLRQSERLTMPFVCAGAVLAGVVAFMAFFLVMTRGRFDGYAAGAGAALGFVAGVAFSLIAGIPFRRRAASLA